MITEVENIIRKLGLKPHPEGGYYREDYRSDYSVASKKHDEEIRNAGTSIYYLLDEDHYSAWHQVKSDETWHYYAGAPIVLYVINSEGTLSTHRIGHVIQHDLPSQITIRANQWFAAKPIVNDSFTLVGCTVYPGFDFKDFRLANITELKQLYPAHAALFDRFSPRTLTDVVTSYRTSDCSPQTRGYRK